MDHLGRLHRVIELDGAVACRVLVRADRSREKISGCLLLPAFCLRVTKHAVFRTERLGFFPQGPAAGLRTELAAMKGAVELSGADVREACQSLAELCAAGRLAQAGDPLLNRAAAGCSPGEAQSRWLVSRPIRSGRRGVRPGGCGAARRRLPMQPRLRVLTT